MKRSLKLALWAVFALTVLGLGEGIKFEDPIKGFVEPFFHHLTFASQALIVGGFLLWIFEETIAQEFGPIIKEGFTKIADSLAGKMVGHGSIGEALANLLDEFAKVFSPGVGQLVKEGRTQEWTGPLK